MKTLLRILIILAAALAVVGVTYAIGQSGWLAGQAQGSSHGGIPDGDRPSADMASSDGEFSPSEGRERPEGDMPEGFEHRDGGHSASPFSTASLRSFAKTLFPIALVILVVTLASKGIDVLRRRIRPAKAT